MAVSYYIDHINEFENRINASIASDQTLSAIRFLHLICCCSKILHQTSHSDLMGHTLFHTRNCHILMEEEPKQILLNRNFFCCSGPNPDGTFMQICGCMYTEYLCQYDYQAYSAIFLVWLLKAKEKTNINNDMVRNIFLALIP